MSWIDHRGTVIVIAAALVVGPMAGTALGQTAATNLLEDGPDTWEQEDKALPDSGGAQLGYDVAMQGADVLVGAPAEGQAYLYEQQGDDLERKAFAPAPEAAGTGYGTAVDIDGDLAAVGGDGQAFVFERDGNGDWSHVATLVPPESGGQGNFGESIAVDDITSTTVVGAPFEDTEEGEDTGAVFVYSEEADSWTLDETLTSSSADEGDRFGRALDLDGTTLLVGAPRDTAAGAVTFVSLPGGFGVPSPTGAAYVFDGGDTGWTQTAQLVGSQPTDDLEFGAAIALDGSRALIGSPNATYVFEDIDTANPTEQTRLTFDDRINPTDTGTNPLLYQLGDVGLDGDTAVIGSYGTAFGSPLGKTFVFEEGDGGTWEQVTELMPRDPESHAVPKTGSTFGWAVDIDDDRAVVGSFLENSLEGQRDGGAAYLFAPCTDDGALSGQVHEEVEPSSGPAQDDVHEANCNVVASNGA